MISPPNTNPQDDDEECHDALESDVLALVDNAIAAGWKRTQVIKALSDLAAGMWFDEQRFSQRGEGIPAVGTFPID
jgi:hypothetical protein